MSTFTSHQIHNALRRVPKSEKLKKALKPMDFVHGVAKKYLLILSALKGLCKDQICPGFVIRTALKALRDKTLLYLHHRNGQITSFIALTRKGQKRWRITVLCTALEYRNLGLASYLLKVAQHLVSIQKGEKLSVDALKESIEFYKKNGFHLQETHQRNPKKLILDFRAS